MVLSLVIAVAAFVVAVPFHPLGGGVGCWAHDEGKLLAAAQAFSSFEEGGAVTLDDSNCRVGGKGIARIPFPGVSAEALAQRIKDSLFCASFSRPECTLSEGTLSVMVLDGEVRMTILYS